MAIVIEQFEDGAFYRVDVYDSGVRHIIGQVTESPLYLVVQIDGGDGMDPPGLLNDGVDSITMTASFQDAQGHVIPVSKMWRVNVRGADNSIYTIIKMHFVNGVATKNFKTTNKADICSIDKQDLYERVQLSPGSSNVYYLVPKGDLEFKVYEM